MARQLLQPHQIAGIHRENLYDEIIDIIEKVKRYADPVEDIESLPMINDQDGDRRLVASEDEFYMWDTIDKRWGVVHDKNVERKSFDIPILNDNQSSFSIPLTLGIEGGVASISSIELKVNGINQTKGVDYDIEYNISLTNVVYFNWVSSDFSLDKTDTITVVTDILTK